MTEQSKIPLPPEGEGPRGNSIERAVEKFELGKFNPPPIPGGLEPRRPRRPVRLPAIDLMPAPAPQPVAAPAPAPVAAPVAEAPSQPAARTKTWCSPQMISTATGCPLPIPALRKPASSGVVGDRHGV